MRTNAPALVDMRGDNEHLVALSAFYGSVIAVEIMKDGHAAFSAYSPSPVRSISPDLVKAAIPVDSEAGDMPAAARSSFHAPTGVGPRRSDSRIVSLTLDRLGFRLAL